MIRKKRYLKEVKVPCQEYGWPYLQWSGYAFVQVWYLGPLPVWEKNYGYAHEGDFGPRAVREWFRDGKVPGFLIDPNEWWKENYA